MDVWTFPELHPFWRVQASLTEVSLSLNLSLFITTFYPDVTPDTTADGAAGIFGLYLMGDTPTADQVHLLHRPGTLVFPLSVPKFGRENVMCICTLHCTGAMGSNHT